MVRKLIVNNPAQNNQLDTTKTSEQTEKCESRMMSCTTPELSNVNIKLEKLKEKILRDIEKNVNAVIDEIKQDISRMELDRDEFQSFNNTSFDDKENKPKKWENQGESFTNSSFYKNLNASDARNVFKAESTLSHTNKTHKQRKHLSKKIFEERESYLTVLLQIPHMKTIYHIFYIILLVFLLNSICYDYFVEGRVNFGLGTFQTGFDKLDLVLIILVFENLFVISLYYAVKGWSRIRNRLNAQKIFQNFWSKSCLTMYIGSQLTFAYVASAMCIKLHLPFVTASVLLLESTRLLMKMHAFVRVNVERLATIKLTKDNEDEKIAHCRKNTLNSMPPLSSYIYFLFAPTLVYKDNYPRTSHIRWKFALNRLLEVIAIAFLYSYIHERYIRVHFGNYGLEPLNASAILVKLFGMIMPSIIIFLCGFYLILHSWLNFTSELLRFGDRMFYKDWWTSVNYDAYFRNWNVVVHDWLYEYIYKDCYNHIFKGSKLAASIMVFMVSALVHEHILAFALQIFFPVMFLFFGVVGVVCVFLTRKLPKTFGNIFLWFSLIFGNSLMVSLYCMEYYANQNCPKQYSSWLDYFIPASWNCYNS